jgi:hypothetical protein
MTLTQATFAEFLVAAIVLMTASTLVGRQIASLRRRSSRPVEWAPDLFSADRYRPMFRLLDNEDIRFLRAQPGATPALVRRLRRQRCQIFRNYLRSLEGDFHSASQALLLVLVQSPYDRQDLISALLTSRLKFSLGVFRVRFRLLLYRWDVGHESVARLVSLFERLQLDLLALAHSHGQAGT